MNTANFLSDLAELLEAGLALDRSLEILIRETKDASFRRIISEISRGLKNGGSLSETIAKKRKIFPEFLAGLVKAAEQSGQLSLILKEAGLYLENREQLKNKFLSQMIYPAIIFSGAIGIFLFLGFFVLPNFEQIFNQNQLTLPLLTRIIFGFFKFFRQNFWLNLAFLAVFFVFGKFYLAKNSQRLILKIPLISEIVIKTALARFCETLAILLASGATLMEALYLSGQTIENAILRTKFSLISHWLNRGSTLKNALERTFFFPERLKQMIAVAEETGSLEKTLAKAGAAYQKEAERKLTLITSLAEPAIIVFMGAVVALIVVSVFLPLINLTQTLGF